MHNGIVLPPPPPAPPARSTKTLAVAATALALFTAMSAAASFLVVPALASLPVSLGCGGSKSRTASDWLPYWKWFGAALTLGLVGAVSIFGNWRAAASMALISLVLSGAGVALHDAGRRQVRETQRRERIEQESRRPARVTTTTAKPAASSRPANSTASRRPSGRNTTTTYWNPNARRTATTR